MLLSVAHVKRFLPKSTSAKYSRLSKANSNLAKSVRSGSSRFFDSLAGYFKKMPERWQDAKADARLARQRYIPHENYDLIY